jgi:hypothetical protein
MSEGGHRPALSTVQPPRSSSLSKQQATSDGVREGYDGGRPSSMSNPDPLALGREDLELLALDAEVRHLS